MEYKFKKVIFNNDENFKCFSCKNEFIKRIKNNGIIELLKCKNKECITNTNRFKQFEIYPIILGDFINLKIFELKLELKSSRTRCIEYWIKKGFSDLEAKKILFELQSNSGKKSKGKHDWKKEDKIKKFGENYFKENSKFCKEYWIKRGLSEENSLSKISELQSAVSKKYKPTEIERKKISPRCKEYWIKKGLTEKESLLKIKEFQSTFSLKKCIEKYGEIKGQERWQERQTKWKNNFDKNDILLINKKKINTFYKKFDEEKIKKFLEIKELKTIIKNSPNNRSKISILLFNIIELMLNKNFIYGKKEQKIIVKNKRYFVDFFYKEKNKAIEFYGNYWHANPDFYKEGTKIKYYDGFKNVEDIWNKDKNRIEEIESSNVKVLIIWENDFINNKIDVINKCIKFLND